MYDDASEVRAMTTGAVLKYLLALAATLGIWLGGHRAAPVSKEPIPVYITGGVVIVERR
jgi:hypothetical protein